MKHRAVVSVFATCLVLTPILYFALNERVGEQFAPPSVTIPKRVADSGAPTVETGDGRSPNVSPTPPTKASIPESVAALPKVDAPLRDQLPALIELAETGSPEASCRLIVSINRCREEQRNRQLSELMQRSLERKEGGLDEILITSVALLDSSSMATQGFCAGVDASSIASPDSFLQRALPSLTPRQKTVLALMQSDGTLRRINRPPSFTESGLYVIPQFQADNTVAFLNAGFEAHDPLALEGLVMLYAPGYALPRGSVGVWLPDPRQFIRYAMLMRELFGPESVGQRVELLMRVVLSTMSPDAREQAERWSLEMAANWRRHPSSIALAERDSSSNGTRSLEACEG